MSIIGSVVRRPVTMLVVILLVFMFSIFSASNLSIDFLPDVEFPSVFVITEYAGVNPEEMENTITKPLERGIRGVANLESISSESSMGRSVIDVTFKFGSGLDDNVSNLQDRINRVRAALPSDASEPSIFRFDTNDVPILTLAIVSNRSSDDLYRYIDSNLLSSLEQIDGVALVALSGGESKKVYVEPSVNRLNAFNITLREISNVIASNSRRSSVGNIKTDATSISLMADNTYEDIDELNNLVLAERKDENGDAVFIRLRDVANVRFSYSENNQMRFLNGRPAIVAQFFKLSGENIVEVCDRIKDSLRGFESIVPSDFDFIVVDDNSKFIKDNISAVSQAGATGGLLAVFILLFFLRNITSILVIAIAMPVSIVLTLALMYFAGLTLNFMSLAGLALGIGMLVDNSVVVLEHIYNKRLKGVRLLPASQYGATEMSRPILASMLTTVLVFVPLLIFQKDLGTSGAFFAELAFTIVVSVLASYLIATLVVPVLTSKYLPVYRPQRKGILKSIDTLLESFFIKLEYAYQKTLQYMLHKPKRFILLLLVMAILPLLLVPRLGFSFLPSFASETLRVTMKFPSTMTMEEMYAYGLDFIDKTDHIIDENGVTVRDKELSVTGGGLLDVFDGRSRSSNNQVRYVLYYDEGVTAEQHATVVKAYAPYQSMYSGIDITVGGFQRETSNVSDFSLRLQSENYDKLQEVSAIYKSVLEDNFEGRLENIEINQSDNALNYEIGIDRELANTYGTTVVAVTEEIQIAMAGKTVSQFTDYDDESYDIFLVLHDQDRRRTDIPEQLYISTTQGRLPIANLIERNLQVASKEIRREDFQRTITITADLADKYQPVEAARDARKVLLQYPQDESVVYEFTGEYKELKKDYTTLLWVFIFAILFVYGIMASQFESFLDPFIIIFTVPLTFAGVVLIYFFTGNSISSFTIVGVVMLVGIAVNHGIVLVDYINLLRRRDISIFNAILQGGASRLQPILMTSTTTIVGLLPIVILNINGVSLIKPLALSVVGGLTASVVFSLLFIPLLYYVMHKRKKKVSVKRAEKRAIKEAYNVEGGKEYIAAHIIVREDDQE